MMRDRRVSLTYSSVNGNFALISNHNKHIRKARADEVATIMGRTTKFVDRSGTGLISTIRCGTHNVIVKTFQDGTHQKWSEQCQA